MKFGKRQIIMAGLVVALGAAVYLNWQFSGNTEMLSPANTTAQAGKELGQAQYVNSSSDSTIPDSNTENVNENNSLTSESSDDKKSDLSTNKEEYFAQAQTDRQKAQDEISDLAQQILESAEENDAAKTEAVAHAAQLAKNIEQQSNIESLIKAKGFADCIAFIQNNECSVVVSDDDLTDEDAVIIKDIVSGQSGVEFDKIKITAV